MRDVSGCIAKRDMCLIEQSDNQKDSLSIFTILICLVLFIYQPVILYAGIEMAEPEYSYREFLNNEIEYDFLTPQDIPASPRYIKFSWQQGYFPENYHYTRIIVQDSIFSVAGRAYYGDKFYQRGASLKIKEEHTLTFDHYNWKHKMGPGITDLSLRNRINLFQKNNSLVLSDSSVRYVLTNHDESRDNDVCQDYSFS